ncbi:unnamed protein product [Spirodela intermedia]|uniref:Uncharacterized protein n=1 Tax=Spirodela intermedia TaxID=51605 RepID=A0A7I8KAJ8_SPIIN|nr:unnamed protein product [Spirodela intermedia]
MDRKQPSSDLGNCGYRPTTLPLHHSDP